MRISTLTLNSPAPVAQCDFYCQALGFRVLTDSLDHVTITTGYSRLTFKQGHLHGVYHYTFNIPKNQIEEAKTWLEERVGLATPDIVHYDDWNAAAIYFRDADNNIVELIARHNLPIARTEPFAARSILGISAIGLPTPDVRATVSDIRANLELPVWTVDSTGFTALGDERGLLIVVETGQVWPSTAHDLAVPMPVSLHMKGVLHKYIIPGLPYTINPG